LLKIAGMVLIFLAGAFAGVAASASLNQRVTSFEQLIRFMTYLETRIRYSGAPIYEILHQCIKADFGKLKFLKVSADLLAKGQKPEIAWKSAIKFCDDNGFTAQDRELIFSFGKDLGSSDIEGQINHCKTYRQLFQDRLKNARLEAQSKGRLYITLGIAGGMGAVLLML